MLGKLATILIVLMFVSTAWADKGECLLKCTLTTKAQRGHCFRLLEAIKETLGTCLTDNINNEIYIICRKLAIDEYLSCSQKCRELTINEGKEK